MELMKVEESNNSSTTWINLDRDVNIDAINWIHDTDQLTLYVGGRPFNTAITQEILEEFDLPRDIWNKLKFNQDEKLERRKQMEIRDQVDLEKLKADQTPDHLKL